MTCQECKYYYVRGTDILCRYNPPPPTRTTPTWWCGKHKPTKTPTKRATKKNADTEPEWTDNFKLFMRAMPFYREPNLAWKAWKELVPEHQQELAIGQAKKYAIESEGTEAKYVKSPANWLKAGGWKTEYKDVVNATDCYLCGAKNTRTHKYPFINGAADTSKRICEKCRKG